MRESLDVTQTLSEKVWDRHVVRRVEGEPDLLYIDLHLVHEVTSPQAFDSLRMHGRTLRRPDLTVSTIDHNNPTTGPDGPPPDEISAKQMEVLARNCEEFGVRLFGMGDPNRGIVHVIGPEQGLSLPGMTIVCGDSHTSTHGAFGALAFGIGTSEVEHVLATQTLPQAKPGTMSITVEGELPAGVTAKDVVLSIIARIGTGGGIGSIIEYRGSAIRALSMEGRMTVCNMSIEAGARAGMVAPDDTTFAYLEGRPFAPKGKAWEQALDEWRSLATDPEAGFDLEVEIDAATLRPSVSWGTNPAQTVSIDDLVPSPDSFPDPSQRESATHALRYMGLEGRARRCARSPSTRSSSARARTPGSRTCVPRPTSSAAGASATGLRTLVVPGSMRVKAAAEEEGLDRIFTGAGFEWREAGCSMCLAMNPDKLAAGERCASTSNRNFEGRQGKGGRTHLVSPAVAAATAVAGHFTTPEDLE